MVVSQLRQAFSTIWIRTISVAIGFTLLLGLTSATTASADEQVRPEKLRCKLLSVRKIWDQKPHNAFTDLVRWRASFYCAFREGKGHVGDRGSLRVLCSEDARQWKSVAVLASDQFDLRDAALSITRDDRLMVLAGCQLENDGVRRTGTVVSFSADGKDFSDPQVVISPGRWLWRVTWFKDRAYGVSYGTPDDVTTVRLHSTSDGIHYQTVTDSMFDDGQRPTEARVRFADDGTGYCLLRRDGATSNSTMFGVAQPPYLDWIWTDLDRRLGGPNFIQIPTGDWIAAGRLYEGGARTELLHLDIEQKTLSPILKLPSGGDTSYPGMFWHAGRLWVSYYSSHEGRASIYLAEIQCDRVAAEAEHAADADSAT